MSNVIWIIVTSLNSLILLYDIFGAASYLRFENCAKRKASQLHNPNERSWVMYCDFVRFYFMALTALHEKKKDKCVHLMKNGNFNVVHTKWKKERRNSLPPEYYIISLYTHGAYKNTNQLSAIPVFFCDRIYFWAEKLSRVRTFKSGKVIEIYATLVVCFFLFLCWRN